MAPRHRLALACIATALAASCGGDEPRNGSFTCERSLAGFCTGILCGPYDAVLAWLAEVPEFATIEDLTYTYVTTRTCGEKKMVSLASDYHGTTAFYGPGGGLVGYGTFIDYDPEGCNQKVAGDVKGCVYSDPPDSAACLYYRPSNGIVSCRSDARLQTYCRPR
jgi:hypothetical protein